MKHWIKGAALGLAFAAALRRAALAQKTKVTIYTSLENDQLGSVQAGDRGRRAEAEVVWVRDSPASSRRASSPKRTTRAPTW
jgi:iron(III) transport system substrate-binding protein